MSIPTAINTQIVLSKSDKETSPHSIILKNSMWIIYSRYGRILIKEYNNTKGGQKISNSVEYFTISNALDSFGVISTERFWLWTIENNNLYVTEIEPFSDTTPTVLPKTLFTENVTATRVVVSENNKINMLNLDVADFGTTVNFRLYSSIDESVIFDFYLEWDPLRLPSNFSIFKFNDTNQLLLSYLKTSSPPNLYLDEYQLSTLYEIVDSSSVGTGEITSFIQFPETGDLLGEILGTGRIASNILTNHNMVRDPVKEAITGPCSGAPGVRVRIQDNSPVTAAVATTSIAGIVGYANKGQFNRITQISSTEQLDTIFGRGFSNFRFNQGYYAARAVLNNGGFVEFVRPYGEEIDPDSTDKRELKSDTFLISYDYNGNAQKNILINHFAATRDEEDGYSPYGKREIFNIDKAVAEDKNYDFTLDSTEIEDVDSNKIALLSIINEDPSSTVRGTSLTDNDADRVVVTTANNKESRTITQMMTFGSQLIDGDIIYVYNHIGEQLFFEFDSDDLTSLGNIPVTIGATLLETLINLVETLSDNLPYHTFTRNGFVVNGLVYFGTNDTFTPTIHDNIFTVSVDVASSITVGAAVETVFNVLIDNTIGKTFTTLGLATELFIKDRFDGSKNKRYVLNSKGMEVSKIFLSVDYVFAGTVYSFYGTIIPYMNNATDLYILTAAESVADGFKVIVNANQDLMDSTESVDFNLGHSSNPIIADVATTSNILLSDVGVIDGYLVSVNDYVLVKNQFNPADNGVYVVKMGEWERIEELDEDKEFNSEIFVKVIGGTTQAGTNWKLTLDTTVFRLGSSNVNFYYTNETSSLNSFFYKYAYDLEDPAVINSSIWEYDPKSIQSSSVLANAWGLFLEKRKSNCDYLVSSGTAIKNLFIRGLEEIDYIVMESMLDVCNLRKDCFSIFDGVDEKKVDIALEKMAGIGSQGLKSRWGAIFDGRSMFNDRIYTKSPSVEAVKSIEVAGVITRNRRGGLYWVPCAGKETGTVPLTLSANQKYTRRYTNPEDPTSDIARLYDYNINPSRTMDGLTVIYGQKTMLKEDRAHNRLNVVMLICGLNKKLDTILDPRMLKLNTMMLRNNLANELRSILQVVSSASPAGLDRFSVVCDNSNNTKTTIAENKLICDIVLYPTKTGECITLRTSILRTEDDLIVDHFVLN